MCYCGGKFLSAVVCVADASVRRVYDTDVALVLPGNGQKPLVVRGWFLNPVRNSTQCTRMVTL